MRFKQVAVTILLSVVVYANHTYAARPETINIGVTAVFLTHKTRFMNEWQDYLEKRLGQPVKFLQRSSYREIMDLLLDGQLDFAWICGYPYIRHKAQLRLMAVPLYEGEPLYRSYLIVPQNDNTTTSLTDLEGKVFAFSDPDSNSGYLVPQYTLHTKGLDAKTFFRKNFFTWAHDKVVNAVAFNVADGGAVDGYVWETLALINPQLTARTRVVSKSDKFGFPPLVARIDVNSTVFSRVQAVFLKMNKDALGSNLLKQVNLDGFTEGHPRLFDAIGHMASTFLANANAGKPKPPIQDPS